MPVFWNGAIAQLGERLHGMQEVSGSIPLGSTISRLSHSTQICTDRASGKWWSQAAECAARQRLEAHEARRRVPEPQKYLPPLTSTHQICTDRASG